jgi:hypothetical protein
MSEKYTSDQVIALLRVKHGEDVFVTECKDGPTQGVGQYSRMDAWSMPRSWTRPAITAYEVKVTRSDFVRDDKWRSYLWCCNEFYFATAPGVIEASELPPEAGLLEMSKTGGRLFLRKKSTYREFTTIEQYRSLENVFRYVLMARCIIREEWTPNRATAQFWEEQLALSVDKRRYGHRLGRRIGEMIRVRVDEVDQKNRQLERQIDQYKDIKALLVKMGLNPDYCQGWTFQRRWDELKAGVSKDFIRDLERAAKQLGELAMKLQQPEAP